LSDHSGTLPPPQGRITKHQFVRCGHHAMSKIRSEDVITDSANQTVEFALTEAVALCCTGFGRLV
jgi:hypothetical protein